MPFISDPVFPLSSRSTRPSRVRPGWAGLMALASIPLAVACGDIANPGVAYDPDVADLGDAAVDEDLDLEEKAAIVVSTEQARTIAAAAPKSSTGLPLWESRPGAKVALFLDFDGGRYDSQDYRGIDRDGNRSRFGTDEQTAIIRAALEVVEGYKGFNINVTTSETAMRKAPKWGWILITDDEGSSGEAYVGVIGGSSQCSGSSCYPMGFAGSTAVFAPPSAQRGYLLIHELGHQFGLNHSGLYKNGVFYEWSELKQGLTSDWLGGRSSYFYDYTWVRSQTKYSTAWQDPKQIIGSIAGTVGTTDPGGSCHTVPVNDSNYCTNSCLCNLGEGDCDSNAQCATGLICEERGAVDVCVKPTTDPGSCHTVPVNDSNYCTSSCLCKLGEGDCDSNSQCATGLICEERGTVDVCVKASTGTSCNLSIFVKGNGGTGYGECQGDCDVDSDCLSGLRCMQLNTGDRVPGCSGTSPDNNDFCVNPICI